MKILRIAALVAAGLMVAHAAHAGESEYAEMVAAHARANGVPEALVHRVIMRESRYQPHLIGRGGTIGSGFRGDCSDRCPRSHRF